METIEIRDTKGVRESAGNLLWVGNMVPYATFGEVHSAYPSVVNFIHCGRIISLCDTSHAPGPFRVITTLDKLSDISQFSLTREQALLPDTEPLAYSEEQVYHPQKRYEAYLADPDPFMLAQAREFYTAKASPYSILKLIEDQSDDPRSFVWHLKDELRQGIEIMKAGNYVEGAMRLKRRGLGLTPSGDDFLIGLLIGLSLKAKDEKKTLSGIADGIYFTALDNDLMVNTFLYQARELLLDEDWWAFLYELQGKHQTADQGLKRLLSHGASSGADQLAGFFTAMELFA